MKRIVFLLVILMALTYFTNPGYEKHLNKLKEKFADEYAQFAESGGDFDAAFEYHNYYFFSTTTDKASDLHELATIGILGFVL
ncbi:hypothetical protein [Ferruginibacter albus]|uniref:hypothetical protein n=1 Tax=Ferruginibacter albus TaxID=2875540 RepID=UPI001CC46C70|nr:hypothetical protein [Ferruginibacter albus]UAY51424.1 hypothetical protein K9M53_12600 [Ferruginibacter albus]